MTIQEAKQVFEMSVQRIERILASTPDDRLLWSPGPAARTPLAQVVHAATSIRNIHRAMMGNRYSTPTREEADAEFLALEAKVPRLGPVSDSLLKGSLENGVRDEERRCS